MSGFLRVLASEELELIAGGSMSGAGDPYYMPPGSDYYFSGIPVFSATSWTTSSFAYNYAAFNAASIIQGFASANDYLMHNSYYHGVDNSQTQTAGVIAPTGSAPASLSSGAVAATSIAAGAPTAPDVVSGTIITVTAYTPLIAYNGYWATLSQLGSILGTPTGHSDLLSMYPVGAPAGFEEDYNEEKAKLDLEVDTKAREIEALIKAKPDWNEREYGAVIYVTAAGEVKIGPLTRGSTVAEAGSNPPSTPIQVPNLEGGRIVAVVHSHPDVGYSSSMDLVNRYPSNPPYGQDYVINNTLVHTVDPNTNLDFAHSGVFAQYILGPDGILREFNAYEGNVTYGNDPYTHNRADLGADR